MQHEYSTKYINQCINRELKRFNQNDLIDFLNGSDEFREFAKENGLITTNNQKYCYLLSERGYTKLVAMMSNDNEKKWEVMDKLIDYYFNMRAEIKAIDSYMINDPVKRVKKLIKFYSTEKSVLLIIQKVKF